MSQLKANLKKKKFFLLQEAGDVWQPGDGDGQSHGEGWD
jgi:hypothetical protein